MMHLAWPWMLLLLPLPWLVSRWLPPAAPQGAALFVPFAAGVAGGRTVGPAAGARWRTLLLVLAWLLLVVAAARPQWLGEPHPVPTTGRRLLMAVDVSGSMAAQDMAGGYSRLQVVKAVAGDFIAERGGDQLGLILFGTRPYLQAPLTTDLSTVHRFLSEAMIGVAGTQTAIGDAIGLAIKRMKAVQARSGRHGRMVMILLTDGSNDAGLMDPLQAAKMAAAEGLRIYTIGVGAPLQPGMLGVGGNTDLDEGTLKSIAQITGGRYFRAGDASALQDVYARINALEPAEGRAQWYRPSTDWFQWPLALALLLSVTGVALRGRA